MKKLLLILFTCFIISSSYAIYYKIPYSARQAGLGEATVSLLADANNIFYNPASLNSKSICFNLTEWFLDTRAGSCFGSYQYENYFTVGAGITYFTYGQLRYFDENGNPGDYFSAGLWQYRLGIAKQFYRHVSVGVGTKVLDQRITHTRETKLTIDYGLIYYSKLFNFGLSLHDPTLCNSGTYFDIGASVKPINNLLLLMAVEYQDGFNWRPGIEYNYQPVSFRIGYNKRFSLGIGYNEKRFSFDCALVNYNDIGLTQQFSITLK